MNVDVTAIRQAILAAPLEIANFGEAPDAATLYIPSSHTKALRLESSLVVGGRGVGKSFWTAALSSTELRSLVGSAVKELDGAKVGVGFSGTPNIDAYPDAETFRAQIDAGFAPYDIWRAVVLRWVTRLLAETMPVASWSDSLEWLRQQPELVARRMQQASQYLTEEQCSGLIVFDALDRSSHDWRTMDDIVRDLLRAALWLKAYPRLHAKVFLREDQFERTVTDFPDASKLLATKEELIWARHDLHGLLWTRLINTDGESGKQLRWLYSSVLGNDPPQGNGRWALPDELKRETPAQRALFEKLAGPWMGRDKRRGVPYTWSVGHLADGRGQTSPRSFLAAIKQAADDSLERYSSHFHALHYESIKRGIQKASGIRVDEIAEDYPWVPEFLNPLQGLNVPSEYQTIEERWSQQYPTGPKAESSSRLPPQHADQGWQGVRQDLIRLGILEVRKDGRIDMPDLYRVGFGIGRRGGVKPKS